MNLATARKSLVVIGAGCGASLALYGFAYAGLRITKALVHQAYSTTRTQDTYLGQPVSELQVPGLTKVDYLEVTRYHHSIGWGTRRSQPSYWRRILQSVFAPAGRIELRLRGIRATTVQTFAADSPDYTKGPMSLMGPVRYQIIDNEPGV